MRLSRGKSTPTSRAIGGVSSFSAEVFSQPVPAYLRGPASVRAWMSWPISQDASRSLVLGGLHSVVGQCQDQPWRCLWRGSEQITMTRPCRRITLHLSQIGLTLGFTFTAVSVLFFVLGVRYLDRY